MYCMLCGKCLDFWIIEIFLLNGFYEIFIFINSRVRDFFSMIRVSSVDVSVTIGVVIV